MINTHTFSKSKYILIEKDDEYILAEKFNMKDWATQIYDTYINTSLTNGDIAFVYSNSQVICINPKTLKVAHASCAYDDTYDKIIGEAISFCRLQNIEIPKEIFRVNTTSTNTEKEVRHKLFDVFQNTCHNTPCQACPLGILKAENTYLLCSSVLRVGDIKNPHIYSIEELVEICLKIVNHPDIPQKIQTQIIDTGIFNL